MSQPSALSQSVSTPSEQAEIIEDPDYIHSDVVEEGSLSSVELTEDVATPILTTGPFRFQQRKCLLTYKSHINKELLEDFIEDLVVKQCKTFKTKGFIRCAHETGKSTGVDYDHTHVLCDFGSTFQTRNCRFFDFPVSGEWIVKPDKTVELYQGDEVYHPNIKKVSTAKHFNMCKKYLSKEDPDNADLRNVICGDFMDSIFEHKTANEALASNITGKDDLKYVSGILQAYALRPQMAVRTRTWAEYRAWQNQLVELISDEPDDRHIIWIRGVKGKEGKSSLIKRLYLQEPQKYYLATSISSCRDTACMIDNALKSGWNSHCLFVNITRTMEDHKIYAALESVKDGFMSATKYMSKLLVFNSPHIVLFANFWPRVTDMSLDRWKFYDIEDANLPMKEKSVDEVLTEIRINNEAEIGIARGLRVGSSSVYE